MHYGNEPRSGRPSDVNEDVIKALTELDRHVILREIGEKLNIPKSTGHERIKSLGLVKKLAIWVSHELKEIHLTNRINACDMYLKRNEVDPFLKRIIAGDQKWIVYNNVNRKRSWSKHDEAPQTASKTDIHQKKIMLSVWWDWKCVVYFALPQRNQTINSVGYCQQLDKLNTTINEKRQELINRKGVIFYQDNARPHTSLVTRQKLTELGWELLMHSPYSPDLAPSDYHLFRSLQNFLNFTILAMTRL
ncbi:histone-lysine N-methyltransferase SETMAR-like [Anastrepha ludens]|uniref:histone-lysine N-methyltransferase SETMAR-like n=1 Tax=Anastrepha ludens TaxID=28586 RepID=UPI0023B13678|nr:histone-lysine N-methyltransferase SETMAR-like [Anastrepha ludens]